MEFLFLLGKFFLFSLLAELFSPKPDVSKTAAAGLKDISFPTVDPTRPHQWLMGRRLVDNPNLFGTWDFMPQERSKSVPTGWFSSTDVQLPTEYYISAAMTLCGGSGVHLKEIWMDDVVVWTGNITDGGTVTLDYSMDDNGSADNPVGFKGVVEFHSGSTTASTYLEAKRGAGNVPAWPHLTYAVLRGTTNNGAWIGTNTTVKHVKFVCERMPTAASTGMGEPADAGSYWSVDTDANPAYAMAEILTDPFYGAGMDPAFFDAATFHAAAKTLYDEGHGTSQLWDSQRTCGDVVIEICRQIGAILQPDPRTGLQTLRLLRATDAVVFTLSDDNIEKLSQFTRTAMDEAPNAINATYIARDEKWVPLPVEVQDLAAIEVAGQIIPSAISYAGVTNSALASVLAMRDLRAASSPLATARLTAMVPQRQKFLPGDAVAFSSAKNGILSMRMRVTSARYSAPGEAACELELIEDVFMSGEAVYGTPAPTAPSGTTSYLPATTAGLFYMTTAPYAISHDVSNHGLFFICAGDASQTGATVGFGASTAYPYTPVSFTLGGPNFPLSIAGTLTSSIDWDTKGSVAVTMSAANIATLSRSLGRLPSGVLAIVGSYTEAWEASLQEYVQITGATITSATSATLTFASRGMADTWPHQWPSGTSIIILTGGVLDPTGLATSCTSAGGSYVQSTTGAAFSQPVALYKNWAGTSGSYHGYPLMAGTAGARAMRPVFPGAVTLQGINGGYDPAGSGLPTISRAGLTNIRLSWVNRGSGSLTDWFSPEQGASEGLKAHYYIYAAGTLLYSSEVDASVQFKDIPVYSLPAGTVVRAGVIMTRPVSSTDAITSAVDVFAPTWDHPGIFFNWLITA